MYIISHEFFYNNKLIINKYHYTANGTNINIINTTINHINLSFKLDPQSQFKWSDVTDLLSVPVPTPNINHVDGNNNKNASSKPVSGYELCGYNNDTKENFDDEQGNSLIIHIR